MRVLAPSFAVLAFSLLLPVCSPLRSRPRRSLQGGAICGTSANSSPLEIYSLGVLRHVEGAGCPGYNWTDQGTEIPARTHDLAFLLPLGPIINSGPLPLTAFSPPIGAPTGIALNGIPFYGPTGAGGRDVVAEEGPDWDHCGGHADANGVYHYHVLPGTANSSAAANLTLCPEIFWKDSPSQHSPLVGFMLDGIPIFGPRGDNGSLRTNLDGCNGHVDQSYAFYHYHATLGFPFLVGCLAGCVDRAAFPYVRGNLSCVPSAAQYDYSSISTLSSGVIVTPGPSSLAPFSASPPPASPPTASPPPASPPSPNAAVPGSLGEDLRLVLASLLLTIVVVI